jgi:hypothetical protein
LFPALFPLIRETKVLDIVVISLENFKASKFARHLRRRTAGGASNDS